MDDLVQAAMKYLSTPAGSFWKWVDDGKVVAWTHGATVAFREEVAAVLQRLAPRGLPPIDSVLLLLAATRVYWREDSASMRQKADLAGKTLGLDRVHSFSAPLIQPTDSKADLAWIVFETTAPVVSPDVARVVCEILTSGMIRDLRKIPNLTRLRGGRVQSSTSLKQDLALVERELVGLTEESLRLRLRTGLDEAPLPADVATPAEPFAVRALLQSLALDDELSGLARVARNLTAVLQLPRAISDSDEMPLGGVSDIANRGSLDRLLLSELAHDDLMLATRVALNEALYLRRETPPSPPPMVRHILLDSSLRMWGVPRVYATAAMLSLAATGPEGATSVAYRASGDRAAPVDCLSRDGLVQHLETLEQGIDPAEALADFFEQAAGDNQPADAIIITSDVALADPEFRAALGELPPCYVASVNREGQFQMWSRSLRGSKLLTTLSLDLDELLKPRSVRPARLIDPELNPHIPALFHAASMPFRLPYQLHSSPSKEVLWSVRLPTDRVRLTVQSGNDREPSLTTSDSLPATLTSERAVFVLTRDRRLIMFDEKHRGAVQVADNVPHGKVLWSGLTADRHICYALIHRAAEPAFYLFIINVAMNRLVGTRKLSSEFVAHSGPGSQVLGATCDGGMLFVIYQTWIEVFQLEDSSLLATLPLTARNDRRWVWKGSRFFFDELAQTYEEWHVLVCDGNGPRLEKVPLRGPERSGHLLALFDWMGHDGPLGVHLRGTIANLSNQTEWPWTQNARSNPTVIDIDPDGSRVLIEYNPASTVSNQRIRCIVDVNVRCTDVGRETPSLAWHDLNQMNLGGSLIHRLAGAHIAANGNLTLLSKKIGRQFVVRHKHLTLEQAPAGQMAKGGIYHPASFEKCLHPNPACGMTVAEWEDGSQLFADSRGLLHLKSSDASIPEASLVLNDHDIAIWTSDGRMHGSRYFVNDVPYQPITPEEFVDQILKPFVERLRS